MAEINVVAYRSDVTVKQTPDSTDTPASQTTLIHNKWNTAVQMNSSSSTDPVTKSAVFKCTMTAGAATIDLTNLVGSFGDVVSFSGLKVQAWKFINPSANDITITFGASNPYLLGGTAFKWTLKPGQEISGRCKDQSPDVGASAKNIDISGTSTQYLQCILTAG